MKLYKSLGQHLLINPSLIQRITDTVIEQSPSHVLEIGPGTGKLTTQLLQHIPLTVVEKDERFVTQLNTLIPSHKLTVLHHNVLTLSAKFFQSFDLIIGNLPYNIGTHIISTLLPLKIPLYFMIQEEVAQRLVATKGKAYGRLSVMAQLYCEPSLSFSVSKQSFTPPPKVNSRLIWLKPKTSPYQPIATTIAHITEHAFQYRRKTITNALKYLNPVIIQGLHVLHIDPTLRADAITPEMYYALAQWYTQHT